jgi:hypothetical protein
VSYLHLQQLATVDDEYAAATAATTYMARVWHELGNIPEISLVRLSHVRVALDNLEVTYIIRLFSEFEALLHDHLGTGYPGRRIPRTAEALVNRVALRERIPDPIRDAAQAVRDYRNVIVHRRTAGGATLSFGQAMAALNRYLARLPDSP